MHPEQTKPLLSQGAFAVIFPPEFPEQGGCLARWSNNAVFLLFPFPLLVRRQAVQFPVRCILVGHYFVQNEFVQIVIQQTGGPGRIANIFRLAGYDGSRIFQSLLQPPGQIAEVTLDKCSIASLVDWAIDQIDPQLRIAGQRFQTVRMMCPGIVQ